MKPLFIALLLFSTSAFSSPSEEAEFFYPEKSPANTALLLEDVITYFGLSALPDAVTKAGLIPTKKSWDVIALSKLYGQWKNWIETELKDFKEEASLDETSLSHILWDFVPEGINYLTWGKDTFLIDRIRGIPPYLFLLNSPERTDLITSHEVEFFPNTLRFMTYITHFRSGDFRYRLPGQYDLSLPDNLARMPNLKTLEMDGDHDSFKMTSGILALENLESLTLRLQEERGNTAKILSTLPSSKS